VLEVGILKSAKTATASFKVSFGDLLPGRFLVDEWYGTSVILRPYAKLLRIVSLETVGTNQIWDVDFFADTETVISGDAVDDRRGFEQRVGCWRHKVAPKDPIVLHLLVLSV
jgi:hypothetical protein